MIKLESLGHGIIYVDASEVSIVRNIHCNSFPDNTVIHFRNVDHAFEVLGTVDEVMDKLGLKHE